MPEELLMLNSGIQTVVPQLATPQYVFLDFDGAVTSYHNRDLDIDIDNILIEDSGFDAETISLIVSTLNGQFDDDIVFTADLPQADEYSTVYIGTTPAFDGCGSFLGLAETIDLGNQIHNDNAFVFLNSTASLDTVVYAIAHETEHIVRGMEHGGEGLDRYAARIDVGYGAVSNGLVISSGTSMYVSSGGTANGTTVNSSGCMYVSSGGTALNIVENGGYVSIEDGATANFFAHVIENLSLSHFMTVHSGTKAYSITLNYGGGMNVSSGGTANNTTVNSGGEMYVSRGGTANNTTVNCGGEMYVSKGGTAMNIVENGGFVEVRVGATVNIVPNVIEELMLRDDMTVHSGTTATSTTVKAGGRMWVSSGGTANSTTLSDGGRIWVSSGGTANGTTVNSGCSIYVSSGGTANSTTVNSGIGMHVYNGGTANTTTLNGASMVVPSGGTANSTTVNSGGRMVVSSGGTANGIRVNGSGSVYVSGYGTATDIVENGGEVNALEFHTTVHFVPNVIEGLIILHGGMTVHSGTTATSTTVNIGGRMYIYSGGTANVTTVHSGGNMYVASGGTALNIDWTPCVGNMSIANGAYATFVSQYKGCYFGSSSILLSSGMTLENKVVSGSMYIFDSGMANNATVDGAMYVCSGGTANNTMVDFWGLMYVTRGGTANTTTVDFWGSMNVSSGGTAISTTVNSGGRMYVSSGGTANNTTVNSVGIMYVSSGGIANNTTVNGGGSMYISSGGLIGGQNSLAASGCLVISAGTIIDFMVAEQENPEIALINHYDYISGRNEATYTITVSETLAAGKYALAGYAGDFNSNVQVKMADGQTIGYITGWRDLEVDGRTYSLSIAPDATLQLTITGEIKDTTAPTITNIQANVTEFTNGKVQVSAQYADETELSQSLYRLDLAGEWLIYNGPITMTDNGIVYFRAVDASGNVAEAQYEVVNIDKEKPDAVSDLAAVVENNLVTFSWSLTTDNLSGVASYEIAISDKRDFSHLVASKSGVRMTSFESRFPASGTYYYRVRAIDAAGNASPWTQEQVAYEYVSMPELLVGSPGDDVFSMIPDGTWGTFHVARWNGGTETVSLAGRNRFYDALEGVGGYDVVALPEGDNALLYNDLLSPSAMNAEASARLAGISEIRGNSGNDVIDLTADGGCYTGDLLLKSGAGNDHLWAGSCEDVLIGGTGNDDLRGGSGDDIYLFGLEWGQDKVVDGWGILVFDNALQGKLTINTNGDGSLISDGVNTVTVSWQVDAGDVVFADVGELEGYRRDTIKAFLA